MNIELSSRQGEPDDLVLSHTAFPLAGKFGTEGHATFLAIDGEQIVAALAGSDDRVCEDQFRIRSLAVRRSRQGEGIGPTVLEHVLEWLQQERYSSVFITVSTPMAAVAAGKAGFGWTGEYGPVNGLQMRYPAGPDTYCVAVALKAFSAQQLTPTESRFICNRLDEYDTR